MPRLASFFAIAAMRLAEQPDLPRALAQYAARWAQVEAQAAGLLSAFDRIDAVLPHPVIQHTIGLFSPESTRSIHAALVRISPGDLRDLETDR